MKSFLLMLQFFTRLPINKELNIKENDFAKGVILPTSIISGTMLGVLTYISGRGKSKAGLGSLFIGKVILKDTIITIIVGVLLSYLIFGYSVLVIIVINLAFMYLYRNYILSRIEVMTGDTLGAAN
jgi:adenosylcobinamide-GDP ribazoletransferase